MSALLNKLPPPKKKPSSKTTRRRSMWVEEGAASQRQVTATDKTGTGGRWLYEGCTHLKIFPPLRKDSSLEKKQCNGGAREWTSLRLTTAAREVGREGAGGVMGWEGGKESHCLPVFIEKKIKRQGRTATLFRRTGSPDTNFMEESRRRTYR
jgi:hypothetical protein